MCVWFYMRMLDHRPGATHCRCSCGWPQGMRPLRTCAGVGTVSPGSIGHSVTVPLVHVVLMTFAIVQIGPALIALMFDSGIVWNSSQERYPLSARCGACGSTGSVALQRKVIHFLIYVGQVDMCTAPAEVTVLRDLHRSAQTARCHLATSQTGWSCRMHLHSLF